MSAWLFLRLNILRFAHLGAGLGVLERVAVVGSNSIFEGHGSR